MADKGNLTRISITVAKNGFEIEAIYEPKKTLSQKKGWTPCSWCEPDKYVVNTKAALATKVADILKDVKESEAKK
jgi:hypothetical protein